MEKILNKKLLSHLLVYSLLFVSQFYAQAEDESWKVYDDSEVAIIEITMAADDLQFMYSNSLSDSMHVASVYFKNRYIDENIDSVGIRLRGNTSRTAKQKSFKLSFNTFVDDGEFYSLEKINLNGEHNDPTLIRSKLCWDLYNDIGMISSRASHAAVYINGNYYGLYTSVEHIDEEFLEKSFKNDDGNLWKCLWPASLEDLGDDPELYKFIGRHGKRAYDLKTNKNNDDYSQLVRLIDILHNTHDSFFVDSLSQIISIDDIFKYYVNDILTGNWDDFWFGWNNYYLYFDPDKNKFRIIPYDYDNTFGIDFGTYDDWATRNIYNWGLETQPNILSNRILNTPKLRNLLTHYLEYYSENIYDLTKWESRADSIKNLVTPYAEATTLTGRDWGFTNVDFHQSYDSTGYYVDRSLKIHRSIKEFVNERNSSLQNQIEYLPSDPIIYKTTVNNNIFFDQDSLTIKASVFSPTDLSNVKIEISDNGVVLETYQMSFQPVLNSTEISKSDRWKIKFLPTENWIKGKLRIIAEDIDGRVTTYPTNGIELKRGIEGNGEIIISEIMSKNTSTIKDAAEEYDDWLELYNPQDTSVLLSNLYLTDDKENLTKWRFSSEEILIESNNHILIWCDKDDTQAGYHTNFKLSSEGEFLAIVGSDGQTIIDSVTFPELSEDEAYARMPNDINTWSKTTSSTPGEVNVITDVKDHASREFQNNVSAFPNPFNPTTTIQFELSKTTNLDIKIFDILGKEVWSKNNKMTKKGKHQFTWNGKNSNGSDLAGGVYLLSIHGSSFNKTIKLLLLK